MAGAIRVAYRRIPRASDQLDGFSRKMEGTYPLAINKSELSRKLFQLPSEGRSLTSQIPVKLPAIRNLQCSRAQDEVDEKRNEIIRGIEVELNVILSLENLFLIHWILC